MADLFARNRPKTSCRALGVRRSFLLNPCKKPGRGRAFLDSLPFVVKTTSGFADPASGHLAGHPGPASAFAGRASARCHPAARLGSVGRLGSDCSLRYLIGFCVERRPTPADRHAFHRLGRLASTASRFQPLVLIRSDVIGTFSALKNLSGISGVIRLNEQIKRLQATRDPRKHHPSIFILPRFIHA